MWRANIGRLSSDSGDTPHGSEKTWAKENLPARAVARSDVDKLKGGQTGCRRGVQRDQFSKSVADPGSRETCFIGYWASGAAMNERNTV
jgi:hypothetical protein